MHIETLYVPSFAKQSFFFIIIIIAYWFTVIANKLSIHQWINKLWWNKINLFITLIIFPRNSGHTHRSVLLLVWTHTCSNLQQRKHATAQLLLVCPRPKAPYTREMFSASRVRIRSHESDKRLTFWRFERLTAEPKCGLVMPVSVSPEVSAVPASYRKVSVAVAPTANGEWPHSSIASLIEQWQKHPCLFTDARARLELSWPCAIRP